MTVEELNKLFKDKSYFVLKKEDENVGNSGLRSFLYLKCKIDNHEWRARECAILKERHGCPVCSGQIVSDNNSIKNIRPDLIKYLKNKKDAEKYSYGSSYKIEVICPECNKEYLISCNHLSNRKFSCKYCSDNLSIPEKFIRNLLNDLNVNYEFHKKFKWSANKVYDFYLKDYNMIIETHGAFHYPDANRFKNSRTYNEEKNNDVFKLNIAKQNNIKNYISINCKYSEFEWLKENTVKTLHNYFDFETINFKKIYLKTQSSLLIEVCQYWNKNCNKITTNTLKNKFKISISTIRRFLKRGDILGICQYNGEIEKNKLKDLQSTPVSQYTIDLKFIKEYQGMNEASQKTNTYQQSISRCCNGLQKTANGFIWKFSKKDKINNEYYITNCEVGQCV